MPGDGGDDAMQTASTARYWMMRQLPQTALCQDADVRRDMPLPLACTAVPGTGTQLANDDVCGLKEGGHNPSSLRTWYGREYGPSNVSMIFIRPPQHGQGGGLNGDAGSDS
jgi:hypothetical protein